MRKTICIEGGAPINTRRILKDAIEWDEVLPLVWNFEHHKLSSILGSARDIRREDDGRITAELVFNDTKNAQHAKETLEHGDLACTIWANEVDESIAGPIKEVAHASVKAVSVVLADSVPWGRET